MAITHLVDVLPSSCAAVVHCGAVICFCSRPLTIEYMDLAEQIIVFFVQPEPKKQTIVIGPISVCIERMNAEKIFNAILVAYTSLTFVAKTATDTPKLNMEIFQDAELLYNVIEYSLVFEHQVLTDVEKKALLEKYAVKETQDAGD